MDIQICTEHAADQNPFLLVKIGSVDTHNLWGPKQIIGFEVSLCIAKGAVVADFNVRRDLIRSKDDDYIDASCHASDTPTSDINCLRFGPDPYVDYLVPDQFLRGVGPDGRDPQGICPSEDNSHLPRAISWSEYSVRVTGRFFIFKCRLAKPFTVSQGCRLNPSHTIKVPLQTGFTGQMVCLFDIKFTKPARFFPRLLTSTYFSGGARATKNRKKSSPNFFRPARLNFGLPTSV